MQITLLRHGKYDYSNGHLTEEGIEESVLAGFLLANAATGSLPDTIRENDMLDAFGPLPSDHPEKIYVPDLIVTSSALRAKETGFVLSEQFKKMGIASNIQNDVVYLNELNSEEYQIDHHARITPENSEKIISCNEIIKTIDFIERKAKEGKKHIVIISHQPNIHALLNYLSKDFVQRAPKNGDAYTFISVDEKISRNKYSFQRRYLSDKEHIAKTFLRVFSMFGLLLDLDKIKRYMPDFSTVPQKNHGIERD